MKKSKKRVAPPATENKKGAPEQVKQFKPVGKAQVMAFEKAVAALAKRLKVSEYVLAVAMRDERYELTGCGLFEHATLEFLLKVAGHVKESLMRHTAERILKSFEKK